jgi:hypothetical protein
MFLRNADKRLKASHCRRQEETFFYPEDEGSTFLRNRGNVYQTMLYPRTQGTSILKMVAAQLSETLVNFYHATRCLPRSQQETLISNTFFRNVGTLVPDYTVSKPRRQLLDIPPACWLQIQRSRFSERQWVWNGVHSAS